MRTIRRLGSETHDPLQGVANLFDVGIVFALGFLVALVTYLGLPEILRNAAESPHGPGAAEMQAVDPNAAKLDRFRMSQESLRGQGIRLGAAYRLESGEVVCVPDEPAAAADRH